MPADLLPPPRDSHAAYGWPATPEPVLLAENATYAPTHLGPCCCGRAMLAGDRVACLVDGTGRWVHVSCTGGAV